MNCIVHHNDAVRNCGDIECRDDQRCCAQGNGSTTIRCCKLTTHTFYDNVGWVTRKLSGILILLLLFAMGYFIQRMICPRPRRHHERQEEPSLFNGHATASQDSLLDRFPEYTLENFSSPVLQLPAYDEVKYLPTYEETMQEVDRDRSNDNLLMASSVEPVSVAVAGQRAAAPDTRTLRNSV
ncbi:hypothetical protein AAFF_G00130690 [Aldrovandia affinis]|uniref:Uncharacterized protein n=1 Tax=Aldrovandia affinis TaxID=143900 RepID=A0AAD7RR03_9TELE|nr:hypothetical protein AAFF_G00130690 [Aldrovandia affinis]